MSETLKQSMDSLALTALRVKEERDEAIRLLKEGLLYSHMGTYGSYKARVREFLIRLHVYPDAADLVKRDMATRHEGRPDQDLDTFGRPLKAGS